MTLRAAPPKWASISMSTSSSAFARCRRAPTSLDSRETLPLQLSHKPVERPHRQALRIRGPAEIRHQHLRDIVLALAIAHHPADAIPHGLEILFELDQVLTLRHWPVAGNDGIEIPLEDLVDRAGPFDGAAAGAVVDERRSVDEQIARMDHLQRREVHRGVTVRVTPAEVMRP